MLVNEDPNFRLDREASGLRGLSTRSTLAPAARNPDTKEQAHARKSTNQHGYDGTVKISRSNRGGDPKSDDATKERATTILE
jgi:hypothetical protein